MEFVITFYVDDYGKHACLLSVGDATRFWGKRDSFVGSLAHALEQIPIWSVEKIADAA